MKIDEKCKLLIHPEEVKTGNYHDIGAKQIGWRDLNFGAKKLLKDSIWEHNTGEYEMCVVLLGGKFSISSKWGDWVTENSRRDVFNGLPHAAYLPPDTPFKLPLDE